MELTFQTNGGKLVPDGPECLRLADKFDLAEDSEQAHYLCRTDISSFYIVNSYIKSFITIF